MSCSMTAAPAASTTARSNSARASSAKASWDPKHGGCFCRLLHCSTCRSGEQEMTAMPWNCNNWLMKSWVYTRRMHSASMAAACCRLRSRKGKCVQALLPGRKQEETPCTGILNQHHKKKVIKHVRTCRPHSATVGGKRLLPRVQRGILVRTWKPTLNARSAACVGATHG